MSAGLDMLGAAIVERFLQHGAELRVSDNGRLQAIFPEPGIGRRPAERDPWMRGYTDGAMRELWEMVHLVPGAADAVCEHVRLYPSARYADHLLA